jgi:serine/threonine-protein kinase
MPGDDLGRATEMAAAATHLGAFAAQLDEMLRRRPDADLEDVARACRAEDPAQRWQSPADLARHLAAVAAARPRAARRAPIFIAAGLAATAAVAAVVVARPGTRAAPRRLAHLEVRIPDGQELRHPHAPFLAVAADGSQLVYNTTSGLYLRALRDPEARLVPGSEEDLSQPFFSPDGRWIGYFAGGELKKIASGGGAPIVLCRAGPPFGASWGRDGAIVFAQEDGVYRVPDGGGAPEKLMPLGERERAYGPQILPGGAWLLATIAEVRTYPRWDDARVVAHSLRSGARKVLRTGAAEARYVPTGHLVFVVKDALHAQRFDLDAVKVSGEPVTMVEGLQRAVFPREQGLGFASWGFSDDGTLVYARSWLVTRERVLALVDREGAIERLDVPPAAYAAPRFSPDGLRVAVQTLDQGDPEMWSGDIWVYDLDGKQQIRQLTFDGKSHDPTWTADGKRITYHADRDLYWQPVDGGAPERLTVADEGTYHRPDAWSGDTLAYQVHRGRETTEIWTVSPGQEPKRFFGVPRVWVSQPAFSPDGKWLAYVSSETGRFEVYLQPYPATGARHRVTQQGGMCPKWSPDGREIVYRRSFDSRVYRSTGASLYAVPVSTEKGVRVGSERALPMEGFLVFHSYCDYDIAPDGQRYVMVYPASGRPDPVRLGVVQGWFGELEERVR